MAVMQTHVDPAVPSFVRSREVLLSPLAEIDALLARVRAGGGEKYVARHKARGKLLPRERIERLLDRCASC